MVDCCTKKPNDEVVVKVLSVALPSEIKEFPVPVSSLSKLKTPALVLVILNLKLLFDEPTAPSIPSIIFILVVVAPLLR